MRQTVRSLYIIKCHLDFRYTHLADPSLSLGCDEIWSSEEKTARMNGILFDARWYACTQLDGQHFNLNYHITTHLNGQNGIGMSMKRNATEKRSKRISECTMKPEKKAKQCFANAHQ